MHLMSDEHPGPSSAHSLSILDVLRPPTRSELIRKRKVDSNPPPKGKRRAGGEGSTEPKTLTFWNGHEDDLPNWSKAARQVLLVQPSSASSERVFSLLRNSFGERQHSSLQDYIEASLMLQYNKR